MKINKNIKLNESKEKITTSVVTDLISRAWEEIGLVKANIEQLGKAYSNTSKLVDIFEELLDSYLIYVGQLEAFLTDNNLVEYPEENNAINEQLSLNEDTYSKTIIERKPIDLPNKEVELDVELEEQKNSVAENSIEDLLDADNSLEDTKEPEIREQADFFVDFDEPDLSEPKLTDAEIYGSK